MRDLQQLGDIIIMNAITKRDKVAFAEKYNHELIIYRLVLMEI